MCLSSTERPSNHQRQQRLRAVTHRRRRAQAEVDVAAAPEVREALEPQELLELPAAGRAAVVDNRRRAFR